MTSTDLQQEDPVIAKFHYTGPTGPDQTKSADFVWSGPVGSVQWNLAITRRVHSQAHQRHDLTGCGESRTAGAGRVLGTRNSTNVAVHSTVCEMEFSSVFMCCEQALALIGEADARGGQMSG